jgi:hypothetical protein
MFIKKYRLNYQPVNQTINCLNNKINVPIKKSISSDDKNDAGRIIFPEFEPSCR